MSKECMSQYKGVPYLFMFFLSQRTQFQIILITFCWQLKFKRKIRFILLKFRFLSVVEQEKVSKSNLTYYRHPDSHL